MCCIGNGKPEDPSFARSKTTIPLSAVCIKVQSRGYPTNPTIHGHRGESHSGGLYLACRRLSTQIQVLRDKAGKFALLLKSSRLSPNDVCLFHKTMYAPAMKYPLPAMAVDEEELQCIQTSILPVMLKKWVSTAISLLRYDTARLNSAASLSWISGLIFRGC